MKVIEIPWPDPCDPSKGVVVDYPVYLGWFEVPEEHIVANGVARAFDQPEPFPDPNLIKIRLTRQPKENP